MKKILFITLALAVLAGCKRKLSRAEVESNLGAAMYKALISRPGFDPGKDSIVIKSVLYYEEPEVFDCQFEVHMHLSNGYDTTGIMNATISKDFGRVRRKS
jgi:hypothetical protein